MNMIFFISFCMIFGVAKSMPGGWSPVTDLNSPEIQKISRKAAAMVAEGIDSQYYMKLINVTKAETQVVSGMNYRFEMSVGPTECEISENLTEQQIEDCPLQECGGPLYCRVKMWVQAWNKLYKVTDSDCQPGEPLC